jgi:hypothetical protein
MKYTNNLKASAETFRLPAIGKLFAVMLFGAASVAAQTAVPLPLFRSIELHDGGHVTLRYGQTQTVTLLKGSTDCAGFTVNNGRLVIDKYKERCPKKYELEIEIITPSVAEISVTNGGKIKSLGDFPRQTEINTVVSNGGTIDVRTILADRITASVEEGGGIFVKPQVILSASIVSGGQITYWGEARVESSIRHGGAVTKGKATEANKPLSELNSSF